ncbi:Tad domain-containing protein [Streptomyces sp. NPDC040724]|uniref:Tad domain-containing protein n=1 Tax=unclassified Streptomyces TaxID=2593676 RepID=UPI0033E19FD4
MRNLLDGLRARLAARGAALDDRGSGAGALIIFSILFLALAAFVVDGGMSIAQRERAADIAEQAARYAAQDIDRAALYAGTGGAPIRYQNCGARVRQFTQKAEMSLPDQTASGCIAADAQRVQVEIQLTYRPVLGLYHRGPVTVRGRATAESLTG